MFFFISLVLACATSDDSGADKQNLEPIEQPLTIGNVVVFPYTQLTSDSYLQCVPEITGAAWGAILYFFRGGVGVPGMPNGWG